MTYLALDVVIGTSWWILSKTAYGLYFLARGVSEPKENTKESDLMPTDCKNTQILQELLTVNKMRQNEERDKLNEILRVLRDREH